MSIYFHLQLHLQIYNVLYITFLYLHFQHLQLNVYIYSVNLPFNVPLKHKLLDLFYLHLQLNIQIYNFI